MHLIWSIFATYFKIGLFTFGGGYAMISLMQHEVVVAHEWVTAEQFSEIIAVSSMTPGAIAINSATFIGYRLAGLPGAVAGVLGVVLPSFMIIIGLATLFMKYKDHHTVKAVFKGIQPAVIALIAAAAYKLGVDRHFTLGEYSIMAAAFAGIAFLNFNPIWLILGAGVVGAIMFNG